MITQMWMEKVKNVQILTPARMIAMDAIKPFLVGNFLKIKQDICILQVFQTSNYFQKLLIKAFREVVQRYLRM